MVTVRVSIRRAMTSGLCLLRSKSIQHGATSIMNDDVAVSLASKNPPGTEAARSGETARDSQAGGNSSDQTIGMARERSGVPPVQPFPLSKDSLRSDQVPPREPAGNPHGGRNSFKNSIGMARAPLPAAGQASIWRGTVRAGCRVFFL